MGGGPTDRRVAVCEWRAYALRQRSGCARLHRECGHCRRHGSSRSLLMQLKLLQLLLARRRSRLRARSCYVGRYWG